jgi:acyl-homoserine-lactone acylase
MSWGRRATVLACAATVLAALAPSGASAKHYRATIRETSYGIPRILADDWGDLGYGYGYALASQQICTIADAYVTVDAQRSRYFGTDGSWTFHGNGFTFNNLDSDFFFQKVIDDRTIPKLLKLKPPRGPRPQIIRAVRGYVAGYNRYLRQTGVANLPDPRCRGAKWVHPITSKDVLRRFYALGMLASQGVAIDGIAQAAPPTPPILPKGETAAPPALSPGQVEKLGRRLHPDIGSNAIGLGKAGTRTGHGMLLGNPHFPWVGSERFFEAQLTIPGKINVSGASLIGVPVINIGHTRHLAWSHTVSTAYRFTPYQETLVPGSPTTYLYGGGVKQMKSEDVTVKVPGANGKLEKRTHTFYSTIHGPLISSLVGIPLPWTPVAAFTMADANADNFRYLNHFFDVNRAQSTKQLYGILKRDQGVPWVNTIAADSKGHAFYADISVVPHVTNDQAQSCNTVVGDATFAALGLPVLDGSRPACEWGSDPDSVVPGIFGPSSLPHLFRQDYVENSNDSYWLSNPEHPLEGFNRIIGDERAARSLRTRLGLTMIRERLAGSDGLAGKGFTLGQLRKVAFGDRVYSGEIWRDELADYCESSPTMVGSSGPVDVSAACPVLRKWDLHANLRSRGDVLFQRFATHLLGAVPVIGTPGIFTTSFDYTNPVDTPSGLNTANPLVGQALADAVTDLEGSNIPLRAPLRKYQYVVRNGVRIPIHGGPGDPNGVFNAINVHFVPGKGYPDVPHGSSFVMAASLKGRCPTVSEILTYSQSENPSSPHYDDQTRLFSRKRWVRDRFCEQQIAHDPNLRIIRLGGGARAAAR